MHEAKSGRYKIICIGVSTGGPMLLRNIFETIPPDIRVPILIAQHIPKNFTKTLVATMDRSVPLSVIAAEDGMPVYPGTIYIGQGKQHMRVVPTTGLWQAKIEISDKPEGLFYFPSADELLTSCAAVYGKQTLGIVLTGIGRDGVQGAEAVVNAGGTIVTQDKESCTVYGMPRSCVEAGFSHVQYTPSQITSLIHQFCPNMISQQAS
ncbi:CheB methylesterase domain-containing protein [Poriferisphaera sp. WC338]|uniref:CheB methylesterase domain-containing protein n=1 Tax=Poriferisphaera sp. WC338 TaxID=3425129 RepID=UPI003D817D33